MDESRRKRRRRNRIIVSAVFLALALTLAWIFESQATTTVVLVRYADVDDALDPDSALSPEGRSRSRELARVIGDIDVVVGVDAIIATQYGNSKETAQPLADLLELPVQSIDAHNTRGLSKLILQDYKGKIVLVITNREALPRLIQRFHGSKNLPPIADDEHDNLYIVSIPWYGKVKTLRLKYGAPYVPDT